MTRDEALLDAAYTVQRWKRQFAPWMHYRIQRYLGHKLGCYPHWDAIEAEIVRRHLAEDDQIRIAA
jgi:hypothetical protein